jgi:hypothetical protein
MEEIISFIKMRKISLEKKYPEVNVIDKAKIDHQLEIINELIRTFGKQSTNEN